MKFPLPAALAAVLCAAAPASAASAPKSAPLFSFAVSGDSRNCGDVVMPAVAKGVSGSDFYWHLGDFRAMFGVDEDIKDVVANKKDYAEFADASGALPLAAYYNFIAWKDFADRQLAPFSVPVYLLPGNHETTYPTVHYPDNLNPQPGVNVKSAADYMSMFGRYRPGETNDQEQPYYAWRHQNVQFVALDNSRGDDFDSAQTAWFDAVMDAADKDAAVKAVVVAMHEALPGSISSGHSMDQARSQANGRHVYQRLLAAQNAGKRVYVLASHSHFVMNGVFNNQPEAERLPGWILGTGGAVRYRLPSKAALADAPTMTDVYGFAIATVDASGSVDFQYHQLSKDDLKSAAGDRYSDKLIDFCFDQNKDMKQPKD
ncbi:MAG: hypothetical protein ACHQ49_14845 [Elusimicrobiota bacterium]